MKTILAFKLGTSEDFELLRYRKISRYGCLSSGVLQQDGFIGTG